MYKYFYLHCYRWIATFNGYLCHYTINTRWSGTSPSKPNKEAKSVIKGGIVGGIIGGVPSAVVGALSQKSKIDTENTEAIFNAINKTKK